MVGQEWSEKPLQRVWPVGAHNRYDLHDSEADVADIPYILENLEPQKAYVFRFAAKNQVGYGEWALEESHTMPKRAAPEEPYIIGRAEKGFVSTPYPDRYELLWSAPPNNGEPIDYFQVIYVAVKNGTTGWVDAGKSVTVQVPYPENIKYEMKDLHADTVYRVELRAHNIIGYSGPAEIMLRTAKGIEEEPIVEEEKATTEKGAEQADSSSEEVATSSSLIIGVVVAALLIIAVVVDVSCHFVNKIGVTHMICTKSRAKHDAKNKDALIEDGGEKGENSEKTPLKQGIDEERPPSGAGETLHNDEASRSINDDKKELIKEEAEENGVKKSASKTSIAKDSAV